VGNTVWKEYRKGRIGDPALVVEMFKEVMEGMEKLDIGEEILEAFDIAVKSNITFCDASYIYAWLESTGLNWSRRTWIS
jgi:predicted nucleic acid-binding protein